MLKISVFGEIIWDVYPTERCIGGAPLNFGAHAALFGNDVTLYSAVGQDDFGIDAIEYIKRFGVKTEEIQTVDYQTGQCLVTLDENKVPSYHVLQNVAYDFIKEPKVPASGDIFYFGTLAIRNETSRNTLLGILEKGRFSDVFCDVNIRAPFYSEKSVKLCFEKAGIIKISREELPTVLSLALPEMIGQDLETVAKAICHAYPNIHTVVITLDVDGAFAYDASVDEVVQLPTAPSPKVSTVGAGDGFSAAFVSKFAAGQSLRESVDFANKFAAYIVAHVEAVPSHDGFKE